MGRKQLLTEQFQDPEKVLALVCDPGKHRSPAANWIQRLRKLESAAEIHSITGRCKPGHVSTSSV
jgi:hypothetical protein